MFRNKRNSLVKRLWKYRINDETKSPSQKKDTPTSSHSANPTSPKEDLELKSVTHSFFKRLKEDQLETLVQAMESKGGEVTPCVPVSKLDLRLGSCMLSPYVLCCRVFRWPDLKYDAEMKRLPSCMRQNEETESVVCCNPYHWSLVVKIDEPPILADKLLRSAVRSQKSDGDGKSTDGCPRIMESVKTVHPPSVHPPHLSGNTEQSSSCDCLLWCTVAYWELRERVGRLFPVAEPSVNIFQQLPHGDGMCLRLFQKPSSLEAVKRTREKIGFGIILSREATRKSDAYRTIGITDVMEGVSTATSVQTTTQISVVSPLSPLSFSPPASPFQGERGGLDSGRKSNSFFSSTSNCETLTSPVGVYRDDGGGSGVVTAGCDGRGVKHRLSDDVCGTDHRHHCASDSMHISYLYGETMDYMQTLSTSPPYFHQPHPSRSPSCLSSSSFSSSPPSSPPLYFNDTSFSDLNYSSTGLNYGSLADTIETTHRDSNRSDNHTYSSRNNKLHTAATYLGGNRRNNTDTTSPPATRSTPNAASSPTETFTSFLTSSAPSGLPCTQGEVWAYNASNFPIFVNSPTLDDPKSPRTLVVKKVLPGYSIKIFDYARAELLERTEARSALLNDGPFDPCSVRISLAKGWGPSYSRQFITSCPCWLEVLLGARRHGSAS